MTAMAYTILKLHANRLLKFKDMDAITDFLQVSVFWGFQGSRGFEGVQGGLQSFKKGFRGSGRFSEVQVCFSRGSSGFL